MSWDVILLKFETAPKPIEDLGGEYKSLPFGSHDTVRAAIDRCISGVRWSTGRHGLFTGGGFSIEFSMTAESPVKSIHLAIRGRGDVWPTLVNLMCTHGWSALDCSLTKFIDPADPSSCAWETIQAFRDRVIYDKPSA